MAGDFVCFRVAGGWRVNRHMCLNDFGVFTADARNEYSVGMIISLVYTVLSDGAV